MNRIRLVAKAIARGLGAFVLILMITKISVICAQSTHSNGVPDQSIGPINIDGLPLDPEAHKAVEDAVKSGDYTRAEELLAGEIDHQPKSYGLLTALGRIFFLDGNYLNCAIAMKKAEGNAPLTEPDRYTLALTYVVLKKPDWARQEFEKLARSHPENPLYIYWQGRIDYDAMHFKAAAAGFERVLVLDPKFMKAHDNLGLTYEALGDFDRAIRSYNQAIDLNRLQQSPSPWPPLNLGTLLIRLGKLAEAENILRESLRYDARFPVAHYEMGRLLEKEKKDVEALQELRQAVMYDPEYPDPHYVIGRIYQRTGGKEQAEGEWRVFQELKQKHPHARVH